MMGAKIMKSKIKARPPNQKEPK